MSKRALIFGTSRDAELSCFRNFSAMGIRERLTLLPASPADFRSVMQVIKAADPHEIYNLSGQSLVGLSFSQPMEAVESVVTATFNILEAIRFLNPAIRFYNAGSIECCGHTGIQATSEEAPFQPRRALAPMRRRRRTGRWPTIVKPMVCSLVSAYFLTTRRRFDRCASSLKRSYAVPLTLGNLDTSWSWASECVDVIWRILQTESVRSRMESRTADA